MNVRNIARYVGISGNEKFKQNSVVNFRWRVDAGAFEAEHTVSARHDNACSRGVPLPNAWRTVALCVGLPAKAKASAENAREQIVMDEVECIMLGRPKHASLRVPNVEDELGAPFYLMREGEVHEVLLVAHIVENQWLCIAGGPADDPLNASNLCIHDITAARRASKRKSMKTATLRSIAMARPEAWSACVALASAQTEAHAARQLRLLVARRVRARGHAMAG